MKRARPRRTYANVVSTLCLFSVLGGGALAVGVTAAPAGATITVGSDLTEAASTQPSGCPTFAPTCTSMLARTKQGNLDPAASPADGTVVGFGIKSGAAETVTFRLLHLNAAIAAKVLLVGGAGTGPTVSLPAAGVFEFPASLPIKAGDSVGFDSLGSTAYGACQSGAASWRFSPPLVDAGMPEPPQSSDECELLVDAVVEPSVSVRFGKGTVTRTGKAMLALRLPGPGTLTLSGSEIRTVTRSVTRVGSLSVQVHLKGDAGGRLARSGHVRVRVSETFAPTGGVAAAESRTVNFRATSR